MRRRNLLEAFCLAFLFPPLAIAAETPPNVLFIAIDDQNDWIGCLGGHPLVKTPNIDRLAARGTLFTNAHCQAPLCNPSRTSLLLGLRPSTTGIHGLSPWFRDLREFRDMVALPQHFAHQGYHTASAGKIYHALSRRTLQVGAEPEFVDLHVDEGQAAQPAANAQAAKQAKAKARAKQAKRGKDRAAKSDVASNQPPRRSDRPPQKLIPPTPFGNHAAMDWGVWPLDNDDTIKGDYKVASWAVEQIETLPKDKPFFVAAGFSLPHVPCFATQKWFDLYPDDDSVLPIIDEHDRDDTPRASWYIHWSLPEPRLKWVREAGEWRNLVRSYMACTSFVDAQVGRMLDALDKTGQAENTIVVLWGDHGWHLGEKGITGKNTLWDRSTRVPLVFAGPGVTSGQSCARPAELLDIYPTLVELCGLPPVEHLEGISLVPQLREASAPRERPAITSHNQGNFGIRTEQWRYIRYVDGSEELYDMVEDPREWHNLAAERPEVCAELSKWLPKIDAGPALGSGARILTLYDKQPVWEGKPIGTDDPIPEN